MYGVSDQFCGNRGKPLAYVGADDATGRIYLLLGITHTALRRKQKERADDQ